MSELERVTGEVVPTGAVVEHPVAWFERMAELWLNTYGSDNTRQAYETDLHLWQQYLDGKPLALATREDFVRFCREWALELRKSNGEPYAQTTRARWESSITSYYDFCAEMDPAGKYQPIGHRKGAKLRTRPGEPAAPTPALTPDQLELLLARAAEVDAMMTRLCALLYVTAVRISELIDRKVSHVKQRGGAVWIHVTVKGDREEEARLDADMGAVVLDLIEGRDPDAPLLPRLDGKAFTRVQASAIVERAGRLIDVHLTPHMLRTTAINVAIEERGLLAGQTLARHRSSTTTERYWRRLRRDTEAGVMSEILARHVPAAVRHPERPSLNPGTVQPEPATPPGEPHP